MNGAASKGRAIRRTSMVSSFTRDLRASRRALPTRSLGQPLRPTVATTADTCPPGTARSGAVPRGRQQHERCHGGHPAADDQEVARVEAVTLADLDEGGAVVDVPAGQQQEREE